MCPQGQDCRRHTASATRTGVPDSQISYLLVGVHGCVNELTSLLGANMAQAKLADGWPASDVKVDLDVALNANEAPSQHGAAADKYYQLLSLHGDTVSNSIILRSETRPAWHKQPRVERPHRLHVAERSQSSFSLQALGTCDAVSA